MELNNILWNDKLLNKGSKLYFWSILFSGIMELDPLREELKCVENIRTERMYRGSIIYGDSIFVFPAGKGNALAYDFGLSTITEKNIPSDLHFINENNWSANCIEIEDAVLFCWQNPVITKYDIKNDNWTVYREWISLLPANANPDHWFLRSPFKYKDLVYFLIGETNILLSFNVNSECFSSREVILENKEETMFQMKCHNNELWVLTECDGGVALYICDDIESLQMKRVARIESDVKNINDLFSDIIICKDYIYLLPKYMKKAYKIKKSDGKFESVDNIPTIDDKNLNRVNWWYENYTNNVFYKGVYYVLHPWSESLVSINYDSGEVKISHIYISSAEYKNVVTRFLSNGVVFEEKKGLHLNDLLNVI